MNKFIVSGVFLALVLTLSACGRAPIDQTKPTFFYSDSCPHCQKVEEFMTENQVRDNYPLYEKNTKTDREAAKLFLEVVAECGLDKGEFGVPLLYESGQCYMGDVLIINHFKEKLGL